MLITIGLASVILCGATYLYTRTSPLRSEPMCPNCNVNMIELPSHGEERTYDVLVCPHCTNTATRVLGSKSRFAWCPSCRQRTLETPVQRLPPRPDTPIQVHVAECCHVCGFLEERVLPESGVRIGRGKVIPFPKRR